MDEVSLEKISTSGEPVYASVPLNDDKIYVLGAAYSHVEAGTGHLNFNRFENAVYAGTLPFPKLNPQFAATSTSARLVIYTRSPSVEFSFFWDPADRQESNGFDIYRNGEPYYSLYIAAPATSQSFILSSPQPGDLIRYDIVMPHYSNPKLSGLSLESGHVLEAGNPFPEKKLVVIGDSVSQGRGQNLSSQSYLSLAAERMGVELFNLSVGQSGIVPHVGNTITQQAFGDVDMVWILAGYNVWRYSAQVTLQDADGWYRGSWIPYGSTSRRR